MICKICGKKGQGQSFEKWVRKTFTDHDLLVEGEIICNDCLFWFEESSESLAEKLSKDSARLVRIRNYSHFIVDEEWIPLSKGDKQRMQELLLGEPFPELAAIAESGQKHIVFRATRNPPGAEAGWVQFEEQAIFVKPAELAYLLDIIESLYVTFSKAEIETGDYKQYRIRDFGLDFWYALESEIASLRESPLFKLALFLSQKGELGDTRTRDGSRLVGRYLARGAGGLQEQVSSDDMETVRGSSEKRGIHEQAPEVRQFALFEDGGDAGQERG